MRAGAVSPPSLVAKFSSASASSTRSALARVRAASDAPLAMATLVARRSISNLDGPTRSCALSASGVVSNRERSWLFEMRSLPSDDVLPSAMDVPSRPLVTGTSSTLMLDAGATLQATSTLSRRTGFVPRSSLVSVPRSRVTTPTITAAPPATVSPLVGSTRTFDTSTSIHEPRPAPPAPALAHSAALSQSGARLMRRVLLTSATSVSSHRSDRSADSKNPAWSVSGIASAVILAESGLATRSFRSEIVCSSTRSESTAGAQEDRTRLPAMSARRIVFKGAPVR